MKSFLHKHAASVIGILSGFDRLVFRGSLREICYAAGMRRYLWQARVLLKGFGTHADAVTERIKAASIKKAERLGREVRYLASARTRKETVAREIAARDGITEGLVCVLKCVEPCASFEIYRDAKAKRLELQPRLRKCLHYYHYWLHPKLGLMHARIQTWFPFTIQVCLNGREWLARRLDQAGVDYRKRENCFVWLEDAKRAQKLFDGQLRTAWPELLDGIACQLNPIHAEIFDAWPLSYYWSTHQSEWATDIMFKDADVLGPGRGVARDDGSRRGHSQRLPQPRPAPTPVRVRTVKSRGHASSVRTSHPTPALVPRPRPDQKSPAHASLPTDRQRPCRRCSLERRPKRQSTPTDGTRRLKSCLTDKI